MKRILIADDDRVMVRLYQLHLRRQGHSLNIFENGEEVLEVLDSLHFDLAILDYMLPGVSGLELIQKIRSMPSKRHCPIIVITGQGRASLKGELTDAGANVVFTKPFSPVQLIKTIESLTSDQGSES